MCCPAVIIQIMPAGSTFGLVTSFLVAFAEEAVEQGVSDKFVC